MSAKVKDEIELAVINERLINVQNDVQSILRRLESQYVTRDQFDPVKKIVYGLVTVVLSSVAIALIAIIIRK